MEDASENGPTSLEDVLRNLRNQAYTDVFIVLEQNPRIPAYFGSVKVQFFAIAEAFAVAGFNMKRGKSWIS
jgi:hypothetical protein